MSTLQAFIYKHLNRNNRLLVVSAFAFIATMVDFWYKLPAGEPIGQKLAQFLYHTLFCLGLLTGGIAPAAVKPDLPDAGAK